MAILNIERIKPGMTLQSAVRDVNGRLLCDAGVEITEKHMKIFRTWGVTEADIKGLNEEDLAGGAEAEASSERLTKAGAELLEIFRHDALTDPVMKELFHLCALRKAGPGS